MKSHEISTVLGEFQRSAGTVPAAGPAQDDGTTERSRAPRALDEVASRRSMAVPQWCHRDVTVGILGCEYHEQ